MDLHPHRRPTPARGATLLELVVVLCVLAVLLGMGAAGLGRARDRAAAGAARDAVAAALARARAEAVAGGGARVVLHLPHGPLEVLTPEGRPLAPPLELRGTWGVAVHADGRPDQRLELGYDGYGIGRMMSRTLRFRRGGAEGRLTVSAYGRVRRW